MKHVAGRDAVGDEERGSQLAGIKSINVKMADGADYVASCDLISSPRVLFRGAFW